MPAFLDEDRNLNFIHKRGSTFLFVFTWNLMGTNTDPNNINVGLLAPVNLTGYTAKMQIRYRPQGPILHEANVANGGIVINLITDPDRIRVHIPAEISLQWPPQTEYVYDIQVIQPDGITYRALEGLFQLDTNITQDVT